MLRMLAGQEEIPGGEILDDGRVASDLESKDRDSAMVFQSYALYPHMTVRAGIKALLRRLETTTVCVTHDPIEAMTLADRIVGMHDGIVEQIGTPLELSDRPGNLSVAQFIGSPAMNVLAGTVRNGAVEALASRWPLPRGSAARDGMAVQYGVRPTDLRLAPEGVPARVVVVGPAGAETELLLEVGGQQLTLVMHGRTEVAPEQQVHLQLAAGKPHLLDAQVGRRA